MDSSNRRQRLMSSILRILVQLPEEVVDGLVQCWLQELETDECRHKSVSIRKKRLNEDDCPTKPSRVAG
jgi:hypothetical protein